MPTHYDCSVAGAVRGAAREHYAFSGAVDVAVGDVGHDARSCDGGWGGWQRSRAAADAAAHTIKQLRGSAIAAHASGSGGRRAFSNLSATCIFHMVYLLKAPPSPAAVCISMQPISLLCVLPADRGRQPAPSLRSLEVQGVRPFVPQIDGDNDRIALPERLGKVGGCHGCCSQAHFNPLRQSVSRCVPQPLVSAPPLHLGAYHAQRDDGW